MFQAAELGQKVAAEDYKKREPHLWLALLEQQQRLRAQGAAPVLIDFAGVRGAGKSECTNLLNKWMDARWIHTHGYGQAVGSETMRPQMWRYWMRLPPRGQIGIYLSGRYTPPLLDYVYEKISGSEFKHRLDTINAYEKTLADDGALILKFWMHISKDQLEKRLKSLEKDPDNHWRITETDWLHWKLYDRFIEVSEQIVSMSNTGHGPWEIVEGTDANYRALRVGESVREQVERHITRIEIQDKYKEELVEQLSEGDDGPVGRVLVTDTTILDQLDLGKSLKRGEYREKREYYQARIRRFQHLALEQNLSTILVFEGMDAGGKGGAIRRITSALDARYFKVYPFAAPTREEHAHHYLWRFWRRLPRDGRLTIFDRSWYGRVLVERLEGFASDDEWRRAYGEINQFESELVQHGILLVKFWMQISKDEQLKRFEAREKTRHKRWKQTEEDWRNRDRWNEYQLAAHDAITLTDTRTAPWILVEANSKPFARIKVLEQLAKSMAGALGEEL